MRINSFQQVLVNVGCTGNKPSEVVTSHDNFEIIREWMFEAYDILIGFDTSLVFLDRT